MMGHSHAITLTSRTPGKSKVAWQSAVTNIFYGGHHHETLGMSSGFHNSSSEWETHTKIARGVEILSWKFHAWRCAAHRKTIRGVVLTHRKTFCGGDKLTGKLFLGGDNCHKILFTHPQTHTINGCLKLNDHKISMCRPTAMRYFPGITNDYFMAVKSLQQPILRTTNA